MASGINIVIVVFTSGFVILLDRVIKWILIANMDIVNNVPIKVFPFFYIVFVYNQGVSFSFLDWLDWRWVSLLSIVALLVAQGFIYEYYKNRSKLFIIVSTLLLSGGLSNIIDRFVYGAVIDYLYLGYNGIAFPIFNFADCMLTLCGLILVIDILFNRTLKVLK